jgi:hypothetical protein
MRSRALARSSQFDARPGFPAMGAFIQWFQCQGAHLDAASMGIIGFPPSDGGRGAVALKDIPVRVL